MPDTVSINRAPVLTLWAAVVAERLGYDEAAALSLGRALAGLNAQAKGRSLGIFGKPEEGAAPREHERGDEFWVPLLGRGVPARETEAGVRAVSGSEVLDPAAAERYLVGKFGEALDAARAAMRELAAAHSPEFLGEHGFALYEQFRPQISSGRAGWGQKGTLDLALIRSLAEQTRRADRA